MSSPSSTEFTQDGFVFSPVCPAFQTSPPLLEFKSPEETPVPATTTTSTTTTSTSSTNANPWSDLARLQLPPAAIAMDGFETDASDNSSSRLILTLSRFFLEQEYRKKNATARNSSTEDAAEVWETFVSDYFAPGGSMRVVYSNDSTDSGAGNLQYVVENQDLPSFFQKKYDDGRAMSERVLVDPTAVLETQIHPFIRVLVCSAVRIETHCVGACVEHSGSIKASFNWEGKMLSLLLNIQHTIIRKMEDMYQLILPNDSKSQEHADTGIWSYANTC